MGGYINVLQGFDMLTRAGAQPLEKPRRFYKTADAAPAPGGWAVRLDERIAKTPSGAPLALPTEALAGQIAAEWAQPSTVIDYAGMPLTRLAFTALDRTPGAREATAAEAARYAEADLLCYFADGPRALAERQSREWGPQLDWAERDLGVRLIRAAGVTHQKQPPESLARARTLAAELDDFTLTGLAFAAALYGSTVLAFAVQRGALAAEAAFELSRLDEAFQEEAWGVDAEAAARTERLRVEARAVGAWFEALGI